MTRFVLLASSHWRLRYQDLKWRKGRRFSVAPLGNSRIFTSFVCTEFWAWASVSFFFSTAASWCLAGNSLNALCFEWQGKLVCNFLTVWTTRVSQTFPTQRRVEHMWHQSFPKPELDSVSHFKLRTHVLFTALLLSSPLPPVLKFPMASCFLPS